MRSQISAEGAGTEATSSRSPVGEEQVDAEGEQEGMIKSDTTLLVSTG